MDEWIYNERGNEVLLVSISNLDYKPKMGLYWRISTVTSPDVLNLDSALRKGEARLCSDGLVHSACS